MSTSTRKIGQRIESLREKYGMSQQDLAKRLGIGRTSISQIENGDRKLCAEELVKLSEVFSVSTDNLLNLEEEPEVILKEDKKMAKAKPQIRISVPQKNLEKFKEVLLYILNQVGSKSNIGATVICKFFYFIDFDFYEKYEEQLIGATYKKNKWGPTPVEFDKIVDAMLKNKEIEKVKSKYYQYNQRKYLPLREPDLSKLKAHEIKEIDRILNSRLSDMTATEISNYSHKDVPWLTTPKDGKIDYESVFYRTPPYSVREYNEDI